MDLPLHALTSTDLGSFEPKSGTLDQWNQAYVRVDDYLRAHRIHSRLHQSRLILKALRRAAVRHEADPSVEPTTLAAQEISKMMEEWFAGLLEGENIPASRLVTQGRLGLLMTDAPTRWPYSFLEDEKPEAEFRQSLEENVVRAGPDLDISDMVPREMDLGPITEAAGEAWETLERWPIIRTLIFWGVVTAFLLFVFWITRDLR